MLFEHQIFTDLCMHYVPVRPYIVHSDRYVI